MLMSQYDVHTLTCSLNRDYVIWTGDCNGINMEELIQENLPVVPKTQPIFQEDRRKDNRR